MERYQNAIKTLLVDCGSRAQCVWINVVDVRVAVPSFISGGVGGWRYRLVRHLQIYVIIATCTTVHIACYGISVC